VFPVEIVERFFLRPQKAKAEAKGAEETLSDVENVDDWFNHAHLLQKAAASSAEMRSFGIIILLKLYFLRTDMTAAGQVNSRSPSTR
jgi:hypothetical protein